MDTGKVNMISTVGDSSVEERRVKQKGTLGTGRLQGWSRRRCSLFSSYHLSRHFFIIFLSLRIHSAFIVQLWMNVIRGEAAHGKERRHAAASFSKAIACSCLRPSVKVNIYPV